MRSKESYDRHKDVTRERQYKQSLSGRDIAPLPPVAYPERRAVGMRSFRSFCELYQSAIYTFPWSFDHLRVMDAIEAAVLHGQLSAFAMPRGSGKTSLCESAALWATLKGRVRFTVVIGSDQAHAIQNLSAIYGQLIGNPLIIEDFPEVCHPLVRLEGIHQRQLLYFGEPIHMEVSKTDLVFPTIPGSVCSGSCIQTAGITGRIRGLKHTLADGSSIRPDLVLIDDPQTDESARSPKQSQDRERILSGAVLGLAGPGKRIAGIMPCTVITPGDMADVILDRAKHPEWNGTRTRLLVHFPSNERLWDEYRRIRADGFRAGDMGKAGLEFYRANRAAMDEGGQAAWPERHNPDELSAIQHAMNLFFQDKFAFWAEYQNEPLLQELGAGELSADDILTKLNRYARRLVPASCNRLTMFVDVQASLLYFAVVAWDGDFSGYLIDYGSFPEQHRPYFTLKDATRTLADEFPGVGEEAQIFAGLERLLDLVAGPDYPVDGGGSMRVSRALIDANYKTDVVNGFCRQSRHAAILTPSHGRYIGATSMPLGAIQPRPGDIVGLNWRTRPVTGFGAVRYCTFDTNYWKSFIFARLAVGKGARGSLTLFGEDPERHRLLVDHLTAEYMIPVTAKGRTVDEWKIRPDRRDNHWLDCLVGAAVAASVDGARLDEAGGPPSTAPRKRVSFAELQANKRRA